MWTILKKPLLYAPFVFFVIGVPLVFFLAKSHIESKFNQGTNIGILNLSTRNLRITWGLKAYTDSLFINSPEISAELHNLSLGINLFASSFTNQTFFSVKTGQTLLKLKKAKVNPQVSRTDLTDTKRILPDLSFPFSFHISLPHTKIFGLFSAGDSISFINADLYSNSPDYIKVSCQQIISSKWPQIKPQLHIILQKRPNDAILQAVVNQGSDSLQLTIQANAKDWHKGRGNLECNISSLTGYFTQPHVEDLLPFQNTRLSATWAMDSLLRASIDLHADSKAKSPLPPLKLSSHIQVSSAGITAGLEGIGHNKEHFYLDAVSKSLVNEWPDISEIFSNPSWRFNISTNNMKWDIGSFQLPLNLEIADGTADSKGIKATAVTSDSSHINLNVSWKPVFSISFFGNISSGESWANVWTNKNVQFESMPVNGRFQDGKLCFNTKIYGVRAYGAKADSVIARHIVTSQLYALDTAGVFNDSIQWSANGEVCWGKLGKHLQFTASHPAYGHVAYVMPTFNKMSVSASQLSINKFPYMNLKSLFHIDPRITGTFSWNMVSRKGRAGVFAEAIIANKPVTLNLDGDWTPQELNLTGLDINHIKENLNIKGQIKLTGRQFYQVYQADWVDVASLNLKCRHVSLSHWIGLLKDSLIYSGDINGNISYTPQRGFQGDLIASDILLLDKGNTYSIRQVALNGFGPQLKLSGNIISEQNELLNDSVSIQISDILKKKPAVQVMLLNEKGLKLSFDGLIFEWKSINGDIFVEGGFPLPDGAGSLVFEPARGIVSLPLTMRNPQKAEVTLNVNHVNYFLPGSDTLKCSFQTDYKSGSFSFQDIKISSMSGGYLMGRGAYVPGGIGKLYLNFTGKDFALNLPQRHRLVFDNLSSEIEMDSTGLSIQSNFDQASYLWASDILKIKTGLRLAFISYNFPFKAKHSMQYPSLTANAEIHDFNFNHESLQQLGAIVFNFFKGRKKKRLYAQKPWNIDLNLTTQGSNNNFSSDFIRFPFQGDLKVKGTLPVLLVKGEINATGGSFGLKQQSHSFYSLENLNIIWDEDELEDGAVDLLAAKIVAEDCVSPEVDSCSIEFMLKGPLAAMDFSYGGSCGGEFGESINPSALGIAAAKGCYDNEIDPNMAWSMLDISLNMLFSTIIRKSSFQGIEKITISGTGDILKNDEEPAGHTSTEGLESNNQNTNAFSLKIESREWNRLRLEGALRKIPNAIIDSPWEQEGSLQWRPPLEMIFKNPVWIHRLKDRINAQVKAKSTPQVETVTLGEEERQLRYEFGLDWNYEFWEVH